MHKSRYAGRLTVCTHARLHPITCRCRCDGVKPAATLYYSTSRGLSSHRCALTPVGVERCVQLIAGAQVLLFS